MLLKISILQIPWVKAPAPVVLALFKKTKPQKFATTKNHPKGGGFKVE